MNIDIASLLNQTVYITTESWRTMGSGGGLYGFVATGKLLIDFPIDEEVYLLTEVGFSLSFRASAVVDVDVNSNPPTIVLKTTP